MSAPSHIITDHPESCKDEECMSWRDWIYYNRKKLMIGSMATAICIGCGYLIWKRNNNQTEYEMYHDKSTNRKLRIMDKIDGKDFNYVNDWLSVSNDVSANKCDDNKVYFTGLISNVATQREHESLPQGTMFIMPQNFRPKEKIIHDLKDTKANYKMYMEPNKQDDGYENQTDKIEVLPSGNVNLIGASTGWFINLSGLCYNC